MWTTTYKLILIAVGGSLGTLARYGVGTLLRSAMDRTGFAWATLTVNLVGCFLVGYLNGLFLQRTGSRPEYQIAILVGFLGGFTTFSTFGWETTAYLRDGQYLLAGVNILVSNLGGIGLVILGYVLGHGRL